MVWLVGLVGLAARLLGYLPLLVTLRFSNRKAFVLIQCVDPAVDILRELMLLQFSQFSHFDSELLNELPLEMGLQKR